MTLTLVSTPLYLRLTLDQFADAALSVYYLSTVALLFLYFRRYPDHPGLLALAGFTAGCAAWTKNEGLLFAVVCAALLLAPLLRGRAVLKRWGAFLLGLAAPLAVTLVFKLTIAPPSPLAAGRNTEALVQQIFDLSRHQMIAASFFHNLTAFGIWMVSPVLLLLLFLVCKGVDRSAVRNPGWLTSSAILCAMLAGYYAVYVVSPYDLGWHLSRSADRLFVHLWAPGLLTLGLAGRKSDETLEA